MTSTIGVTLMSAIAPPRAFPFSLAIRKTPLGEGAGRRPRLPTIR
jgi:hypothetical protein